MFLEKLKDATKDFNVPVFASPSTKSETKTTTVTSAIIPLSLFLVTLTFHTLSQKYDFKTLVSGIWGGDKGKDGKKGSKSQSAVKKSSPKKVIVKKETPKPKTFWGNLFSK